MTIVSPPQSSGTSSLLDQLLAHTRRVGVFAVDLRDRHDDRHVGRARVVDRFDRLRHHTVVGGNNEDRNVGGPRAAGAHRRERLVPGVSIKVTVLPL